MQCKNCGENFNGNFCPKCGTKIDDEQVKAVSHKNSSIVFKMLILFSIICFAFPFFNVSCSYNEDVSVNYSGLQLVGIVQPDEEASRYSNDSGNDQKSNVFIGISLVALVGAFILTFIKAAKKYTFVLPLISAASLLLSKFTFSLYYNFKDYEDEIVVTTKLGFYIALLMIIISAFTAYIVYSSNYGATVQNAPVEALPGPANVPPLHNDTNKKEPDGHFQTQINHSQEKTEGPQDHVTHTEETAQQSNEKTVQSQEHEIHTQEAAQQSNEKTVQSQEHEIHTQEAAQQSNEKTVQSQEEAPDNSDDQIKMQPEGSVQQPESEKTDDNIFIDNDNIYIDFESDPTVDLEKSDSDSE